MPKTHLPNAAAQAATSRPVREPLGVFLHQKLQVESNFNSFISAAEKEAERRDHLRSFVLYSLAHDAGLNLAEKGRAQNGMGVQQMALGQHEAARGRQQEAEGHRDAAKRSYQAAARCFQEALALFKQSGTHVQVNWAREEQQALLPHLACAFPVPKIG